MDSEHAAAVAAAVTTGAQDQPDNNNNNNNNHDDLPTNSKAVQVTLGELLGEGGFSAIYSLSTIQDKATGQWILAPPPKPNNKSSGHRRGSSAFSSFGSSQRKTGLAKHRHSSPGIAQSMGALPPLMRSVELTYIGELISPTTAEEGDGAAFSNTTSTTRSSFRFNSNSGMGSEKKSGKGPQYVVKCLKSSVLRQGDQLLQQGLKDMHIEAEMLLRLSHPHILPIRAVGTMELDDMMDDSGHGALSSSSEDDDDTGQDAGNDYENYNNNNKNNGNSTKTTTPKPKPKQKQFPILILDRLVETLEDKLEYWETKHLKHSSLVGKLVTHRKHDKSSFYFQERIQYIFDIGSALQYLHHKKIAMRDIKPENVGFDRSEKLQLLDFGLAKDISNLEKTKDGLYNLTGLTGSARYMAPEVAKEKPYNLSCDIYAFSIVIWQIMALKQPYAKYNVHKMFQQVYNTPHVRPSLEEVAEFDWLTDLLGSMWTPTISKRYSIDKVMMVLQEQKEALEKKQEGSNRREDQGEQHNDQ